MSAREEKSSDKFISVEKIMEILSCKEGHVYNLIQEGELSAIKIGQRALRVSENSLNDFIARRRVNPEDYFAPVDEETKRARTASGTSRVQIG